MSKQIKLLDAVTTNTTGGAINTPGGIFQILTEGTIGTNSITLDTSLDGTNWQDVFASDGTELVIDTTANYVSTIRLQSALYVRAVLATADGTAITVSLV